MYRVGKIVNTHGIKGEVKVMSTSDFDRFKKGNTLYYYNKKEKVNLKIKSVRMQNEIFLIKFEGFNSLTEVEDLKGLELFTSDRPELEEDEYIKEDLIGLSVYSTEGELIGKVIDLRFLPSQELLVVKGEGKKEILIPLIAEFVVSINDKIIVKVIEGLI
ncbi:MAG TPA: 16S rRNA processing protein RimM [Acholeplasmataceae bacterium]|jgi:16S rRNA processing protein RimM|nr:16S rRNA processing protein RimM [Acholeplasmataceae bacterium]